AAGSAIYTARAYPKEYWNRVQFVCEPTGHLVAMFRLTPDGSDFKASYWGNLLASDDEWCAPIAAEVGPDGNVWVIDWYNFIVQHNPTPPGFRTGRGNAYDTDLRDKQHGRIYRVVPRAAKPLAALHLDDAKPEQLVDTLKNDNLFWRLAAQRMLVETTSRQMLLDISADSETLKGLAKLVKSQEVDEVGLNVGAIHALWTMFGWAEKLSYFHGFVDAITPALSHKSAAVRRAAILGGPESTGPHVPFVTEDRLSDPDPHVRLAVHLNWAAG